MSSMNDTGQLNFNASFTDSVAAIRPVLVRE